MKLIVPIAAMTLMVLAASPSCLQAQQEMLSADDQSAHLFHNMYTTGPGTHTAGMYPAPHPTPRIAGHVFYTYQPFAPHQMMYEHNRTYYNVYGAPGTFYQDPCANGRCGQANYGVNMTTVVWQHGGTFATPYPFQFRNHGNRFGHRHLGGRAIGGAAAPCNTCQ
jgi:hypothetical protein